MADEPTCSGREVKDKYGQDTGEDAGDDDVDDVEERLPLDDKVESDVLIQLLFDIFSGGFVTNGPFSILCEGHVNSQCVQTTILVLHLLLNFYKWYKRPYFNRCKQQLISLQNRPVGRLRRSSL